MAVDVPMNLEQVQSYYSRPALFRAADEPKTTGLKIDSLREAALGIGVKAGLRSQLTHINLVIESKKRELDTIYDFGNLMIRDRVVPAVITEARDLYNQDGAYALRLSGAYYKIESQPRFSSVPPNWRDYLGFGAGDSDNEPVFGKLRPKTDEENEIWREYIGRGWSQGIEQANVMLQYGMDRLNRDLTGMIRFHTFVMQKKITMPAIASQSWAYSAQKAEAISVDETLLRITTLPEFNQEINKWRASVKTSEIVPPYPAQPTRSMNRIKRSSVTSPPAAAARSIQTSPTTAVRLIQSNDVKNNDK